MSALVLARALAGTAIAMLALDLLWLGVVAKGFYAAQMGSLLRSQVRWGPAAAFYLVYVVAIVVFVVAPALEHRSLGRLVAFGAFFGFAAYATYDLTSLALIRDFPARVVLVDLAWGTVLTAVAATAGYYAARGP